MLSIIKVKSKNYRLEKERSKSSFEVLDSIQGDNIYRVYPDKVYCNTFLANRCIANIDKLMLYSDDDHLSNTGATLLNDLIVKKINEVEKN